uniref:ENV2 protein n=1 Tax=Prolemur simus TaxID=1328070 RepID=A0A8C8YIV3_PROSS
NGFFACPGFRTGEMRRTCGGVASLYCAAWRRVTTNDGEWKWQVQPLLIEMSFVRSCSQTRYASDCNLIRVRFTDEGKKDRRWVLGLYWGLILYDRSWGGRGTVIQFKLRVSPILGAVGPNRVLTVKQYTSHPTTPKPTSAPLIPSEATQVTPRTQAPVVKVEIQVAPGAEEPQDPLWKMLIAAYEALNRSDPNATAACWLCYDIRPPFYEAVGVAAPFNYSEEEAPGSCIWDRKGPGLTLQVIAKSGICIGKVPPSHAQFCAIIHPSVNRTEKTKWIVPALNGW